jgi:hypothetical protein
MRLTMTAAAALLLAAGTAAVSASAQGGPLTARDVAGSWVLRIMPSERRGVTVRGRPETALTVAARGGALVCTLDGEPANCAIRDGAFAVAQTHPDAVMTFTMSGRIRDGFSGSARIRVRRMPFSGDIGPVNMVRAP